MCGDFRQFLNKNFHIWDHFFPLLFHQKPPNLSYLESWIVKGLFLCVFVYSYLCVCVFLCLCDNGNHYRVIHYRCSSDEVTLLTSLCFFFSSVLMSMLMSIAWCYSVNVIQFILLYWFHSFDVTLLMKIFEAMQNCAARRVEKPFNFTPHIESFLRENNFPVLSLNI